MSVRVSITLLISLLLIGVFLFFSYYIVRAAMNNQESPRSTKDEFYRFEQNSPSIASSSPPSYAPSASASASASASPPPNPANIVRPPLKESAETEAEWAQPIEHGPEPQHVPNVTGQSEEELTAPEPLQATPPTTFYEPPEATDPMNKTVHMSSTFGSNLRHPEQMIEKHPRRTMKKSIHSGLASEDSFNFGKQETQYSEEMIQNGGLMDNGIIAHEGQGHGLSFSMI